MAMTRRRTAALALATENTLALATETALALPAEHDRAAAGLLQAVELEVAAHLGVAVRKVLTFLELARAVAARNRARAATTRALPPGRTKKFV